MTYAIDRFVALCDCHVTGIGRETAAALPICLQAIVSQYLTGENACKFNLMLI